MLKSVGPVEAELDIDVHLYRRGVAGATTANRGDFNHDHKSRSDILVVGRDRQFQRKREHGRHALTGGSGDDYFAFQQPGDGLNTITDFNNTTQHDRIAIAAVNFGLTAGMDASSVFESSSDDQFSGFGAVFHFDTANHTLYYSADGTSASEVALAQLQAGATFGAHDLLLV